MSAVRLVELCCLVRCLRWSWQNTESALLEISAYHLARTLLLGGTTANDVYLSFYESIYLSVYLYLPSIYLPIYLSIYSSVYLSIYPSINSSIYLYFLLCIYLLIHLGETVWSSCSRSHVSSLNLKCLRDKVEFPGQGRVKRISKQEW